MKFHFRNNKIMRKRDTCYFGDYRISKLGKDFVFWDLKKFTKTGLLVVQFAEDGNE